jgi:hypothetical protein
MQHDRNTESAPDRSRSAPPDRDALAQIAEILERLTMPSENRVYIPDHAQFLVTRAALYAVQDTPRARDGGTKKTREELKILVKRAVALRNHILSMHRDTLAAIRDQPDHDDPPVIARDLWNLAIAADRAYGKLQGATEKPDAVPGTE